MGRRREDEEREEGPNEAWGHWERWGWGRKQRCLNSTPLASAREWRDLPPVPDPALMPRRIALLLILPALLGARAVRDEPPRTTKDGVYTAAQAAEGEALWKEVCQSCHLPGALVTPATTTKWFGRPLADLYGYIRREMPQLDPGSLTDDEYRVAVAYLLKQFRMPAGTTPLPADSAALAAIRIDSLPSASRTGSR